MWDALNRINNSYKKVTTDTHKQTLIRKDILDVLTKVPNVKSTDVVKTAFEEHSYAPEANYSPKTTQNKLK